MAVNDPTTNFEWALPDVDGTTDVWDDNEPTNLEGLNSLFNEIDSDIQTEQDALDAAESDISDLDTRITSLESAQILPVYARVTLATSPATSGPTTLSFSEVVDSQGMFDAGEPTRLTIPDGSDGPLSSDGRFNLGGLYNIRAQVHVPIWAGDDDGRSFTLEIRKNGSTTIASRRWPSLNDDVSNDGDELTLMLETMDEGAVGDYYEVRLTTSDELDAGSIRSASFDAYRLPSPRFAVPRVLYSAGLDVHGNDVTDFDRYDSTNDPGNNELWDAADGKFGGGCLRFDRDAQIGRLELTVLDTAADGGIVSLYADGGQISATSPTEPRPIIIMLGSTEQLILEMSDEEPSVLRVFDDSGLLGTGTTSLSDNTYYHIEVVFTLSASGATGSVQVYLDGELEIGLSGIDVGPDGTWDKIAHKAGTDADGMNIDDLVVQDANGTLLGDGHRIYTVSPDSDAGTNEWSGASGAHHDEVDDTDPDQDSTALNTSTDGAREEFGFTLPAITGDIREVVVKSLSRAGDLLDGAVRLGLRAGGTDSLSDAITVPVTSPSQQYKEQQFAVAGNPNGGEWTTDDLEDAVIVLEYDEGAESGAVATTQVWLEIITTA